MADATTKPSSILSQKDREYLTDKEEYLETKKYPRQTENERKGDLKDRVRAGIIDFRLLTERVDDDQLELWQIFDGDDLITSGLVYMFGFAYWGLLEQGYSKEAVGNLIEEAIEHQDPEVLNVDVCFEDQSQDDTSPDINTEEAYLKLRKGPHEDLTIDEINHLLFHQRDKLTVTEDDDEEDDLETLVRLYEEKTDEDVIVDPSAHPELAPEDGDNSADTKSPE